MSSEDEPQILNQSGVSLCAWVAIAALKSAGEGG